jgi:hypothetical protein
MLLKYISIKIFIISFIVGLVFVYMFKPEMKAIYVYPTPQNIGKIQYKDAAGNCFAYEATAVNCPSNPADISDFPIQT